MPAAVVSQLHFREPPDPELFARAQREVVPEARSTDGIRGLHIVETDPEHFVLVIVGDDAEVIERFATQVGSPWMTEHVVPLLASPPERHLGPLVATTG